MPTQSWLCAAWLAFCSVALSGCSSPFASDDIYDRLSRDGIARPSDDGTLVDHRQSRAPELPVDEITMTDLFQRAELTNPTLRSSRSEVGVAAGQTWQAGLYPNPTAQVMLGEINIGDDSANTLIGVSQPIVIGGRLRAAIIAADAEEAAKLADVQRVRLEIFGRIAVLHAQVLELNAQLTLIDELLSIGEQTLGIAEKRFEARAAAEPDVIRPRVEVHQLRADRTRIIHELRAVEKQLGLMLDTEPVSADRLVSRISLNPDALNEEQLIAAVKLGHPALIVAEREIDATQAAMERIRAQRVPDLNLIAGIGYSEEDERGIAEIGVSAQLPLWDRRQGDMMSARFELMKRRQDKIGIENQLLSDLVGAIGEYDSAREQLRIIRDDVVLDAQRAFEQIDESYRAGRASFIDLLDVQRTLIQSRRTQTQLAGQAAVARARVFAITGTEFLFDADHDPTIPNPVTASDEAEEHQ